MGVPLKVGLEAENIAPDNGFEPSLLGFQSNVLPLNTMPGKLDASPLSRVVGFEPLIMLYMHFFTFWVLLWASKLVGIKVMNPSSGILLTLNVSIYINR